MEGSGSGGLGKWTRVYAANRFTWFVRQMNMPLNDPS